MRFDDDNKTNADEAKSLEMRDAEIEVLEDVSIDISEADKEMIRMDADSPEEAEEIIAAEVDEVRKKETVKRAKQRVNEETPSSVHSQRPSGGVIRATGEIHSKHAYMLLIGRRANPAITGLYGAAKRMNNLIRDYRRGCLYAAKFLIDTEAEINHIKKLFELKQEENKNYLESKVIMQVEPYRATHPSKPEWVYFSPYAWHFNELLLRYDRQVCQFYPYYAMRMIDRKEFQDRVTSLSRELRRLFSMNNKYYWVGPESFRKQDEIYMQAVSDFGVLNQDIIDRKVVPHFVEIPKQFL